MDEQAQMQQGGMAQPAQQPQGGDQQGEQIKAMAIKIIQAIQAGQVSPQDIMNDPNIPSVVKQVVMRYLQHAQQQQGGGQPQQQQPMQ